MTTSGAEWARRYLAGLPVRGRRLADLALLPAEFGYRGAVKIRRAAYARGLLSARLPDLPVLSVGNLLVGGAGKTPVTAYLARRLAAAGARPAVIHGGYAGDEPLLHRFWNPAIPVIVDRSRARAVRAAADAGANVAVLDDAFQHLALARSADVVLVPVERWEPRPRLLPRGPWREAPSALAGADLIGLTHRGSDPAEVDAVRRAVGGGNGPALAEFVLEAVGWHRLEPGAGSVGPATGPDDDEARAPPAAEGLAVCAVADPDGFRRSAVRAGARVGSMLTFGDHHEYDAGDLRHIARTAAGRPVLTTEKDAVKLSALAGRAPVWVLRERVRVGSGDDEVERLLRGLLR